MLLVLISCGFADARDAAGPQSPDAESLYAKALEAFAAGAYEEARQAYAAIDPEDLPADQRALHEIRLLDATWRALQATRRTHVSEFAQTRERLQAIVETASEDTDLYERWIHAAESLANLHVVSHGAEQMIDVRLEIARRLAAEPETPRARERYLHNAVSLADWRPPPYLFFRGINKERRSQIVRVLDNALPMAERVDDKITLLQAMDNHRYTNRQGGLTVFRARERLLRQQFAVASEIGYHRAVWRTLAEHLASAQHPEFGDALGDEQEKLLNEAITLFEAILAEDSQESVQTEVGKRLADLTKPWVAVHGDGIFAPGSYLDFTLTARNLTGDVVITLYRIDPATPGGIAGRSPRQSISSANLQLTTEGAEVVLSWEESLPPRPTGALHNRTFRAPQALPAGHYILQAANGETMAHYRLLVTSLQVQHVSVPGISELRVTDLESGEPIPGATIHLWRWRPQTERWDSPLNPVRPYPINLTTDATGTVSIAGHLQARDRWMVSVQAGGQSLIGPLQGLGWNHSTTYGGDRPGELRALPVLDRPIHRPGETVRFKLHLKHTHERAMPAPGAELSWILYSPEGDEIEEGTWTVSEFGTVTGEIETAVDWRLGGYYLDVEFEEEPEEDLSLDWVPLFRLEELRLPEFMVSVEVDESDVAALRVGEPYDARVHVTYLNGEPVPNATVEVRIASTPARIPEIDHDERWDFSDRDVPSRAWFSHWNRWDYSGTVRETLTVETNALGVATVSSRIPEDPRVDWFVEIHVKAVDASRREESGQTRFVVPVQPVTALLRSTTFFGQVGEEILVELETLDSRNRPVPASGRIEVVRVWTPEAWINPAGEIVSDGDLEALRQQHPGFPPLTPLGTPEWERVETKPRQEKLMGIPLDTAESGEATVRVVGDRPGIYQFRWISRESAEVVEEVLVAPAEGQGRFPHNATKSRLIPERDTFRAGESIRLLVLTPRERGEGVLLLQNLEGFQRSSFRWDHGFAVLEIPGSEAIPGSQMAEISLPGLGRRGAVTAFFEVERDEKDGLSVAFEPLESPVEPGAEGTARVRVTDFTEQGVEAEVALVGFDAGLLSWERNPDHWLEEWTALPSLPFVWNRFRVVGGISDQAPILITTDSPLRPAAAHSALHGAFQYSGVQLSAIHDGEVVFELSPFSVETGDDRGYRATNTVSGTTLLSTEMRDMPMGHEAITEEFLADLASSDLRDALEYSAGAFHGEDEEPTSPGAPPRQDFSWTALWAPELLTDAEGHAEATFRYPDSLTGWAFRAFAIDRERRMGLDSTRTATQLPFQLRVNTPRFLLSGDHGTITALLRNNRDEETMARVSLTVEGLAVRNGETTQSITIPANDQVRVEWRVEGLEPGDATLTLQARTDSHADAIRRILPIQSSGFPRREVRTEVVRGTPIRLELPRPQGVGDDFTVELTFAPSALPGMIAVLPYLMEFPYNCREQALSRILAPSLLANALEERGIDPTPIVNPPATAAARRLGITITPGSGLDGLARAILDPILQDTGDTGWGWFPGGTPNPFITAYLLWGMHLLDTEDTHPESDERVADAADWLRRHVQTMEGRPDLRAWIAFVLAEGLWFAGDPGATEWLHGYLAEDPREQSAAVLALNALTAARVDSGHADRFLRLLLDRVRLPVAGFGPDDEPKTAFWGDATGNRWQWMERAVPATAFALMALAELDPESPHIEAATRWLLQRRLDRRWANTLDTSIALIALTRTEILRSGSEAGGFTLHLQGREHGHHAFLPEDHITQATPIFLTAEPFAGDADTLAVDILPDSPDVTVYAQAIVRWIEHQRPVPTIRRGAALTRELELQSERPSLLAGPVLEPRVLQTTETVQSGDRVHHILTLQVPTDMEFLLVEAPKPAGFEHTQQESGRWISLRRIDDGDPASPWRFRSARAYDEWRENRAVFFIDHLPEGTWEIRYTIRAESPGVYWTPPPRIESMYAPEIHAHGADFEIAVEGN